MRGQLFFLLATVLLGTASAKIEATGELNLDILDGSDLLDGLLEKNGRPSTDTCSNAVSCNE